MGWGGGLLHSHVQTYPVGSNQQQVTCYHYKDNNNEWTVLPRWDEPEYNPNGEMRYLKHDDVIRLRHVPTTRNLHSHTVREMHGFSYPHGSRVRVPAGMGTGNHSPTRHL